MITENRQYHREIWQVYPPLYSIDQLPDADLLFAVWAKNGFGLFSAASTRFKAISNFATIGCGGELAHYLCSDVHSHGSLMDRCVSLAAHMLEQVKTNVPGCGGESYIATLTRVGAAQLIQRPEADEIGKHLATSDQHLRQMLVMSGDLSVDDKKFRTLASAYSQMLVDSRRKVRKAKEKRRQQLMDLFKKATRGKGGTPMPSVDQT
jgi:hypothetical protein